MNLIDAEDQVERAAFLRDHGWKHDDAGWFHPRLEELPRISTMAAIELQREASIGEAAAGHSPAGPARSHIEPTGRTH